MQHLAPRVVNLLCFTIGTWLLSQRLLVSLLVGFSTYIISHVGYGWPALQVFGIATLLAGFSRYFSIIAF
jgi:hypothetical protein